MNLHRTPTGPRPSLTRCALAAALIILAALTQLPSEASYDALDPSLAAETKAAVQRAVKWLVARQHPDGHWSNSDFPALTALPLWAIERSGDAGQYTDVVQRAVGFILSCAHPNGAIYRQPTEKRHGGGLPNYNTAICLVALHSVGDPKLTPVILAARRYLAQSQHLKKDMYYGGMGYDPSNGRDYTDLSNSYIAFEAMRLTQEIEDRRRDGSPHADLDWQAARRFLARVQNLPSVNDQPWATDDPEQRGGFVYRPDKSQAGSYTDTNGVVRFRSYGSMTYAGLLSLIYAGVDRDDPRVRSAFDWSIRHWTLEENPGMGKAGLYYFYNVLAKALAAYGRNPITLENGSRLDWRSAMIRRLLALQKINPETGNGYWVNDQGRWWEADPVLVTSYSLLTLEIAAGRPRADIVAGPSPGTIKRMRR